MLTLAQVNALRSNRCQTQSKHLQSIEARQIWRQTIEAHLSARSIILEAV